MTFTNATPAQVARLIDVTAQLGPWAMPVATALRDGLLDLVMPRRADRAPLPAMRRSSRPVLVWIGDDNELTSGPEGWRCALAVTRWAKGAVIHAAAGEAEHYRIVVRGTLIERRFVLIETASQHALAWSRLLSDKPVLHILPRGGSHPIPGQLDTRH